MSVETEFLKVSADNLLQSLERIETCAGYLSYEQIWTRQSENENSIGNLLLHLQGNVRQWILSGVGGQPDTRQRDPEFAARSGPDAAELLNNLRSTVSEAAQVIRHLAPAKLLDRIQIQGYDVTLMGDIYHVVEHFCGHTFQIILLCKLFTGKDLGFYAHLQGQASDKA
jgi:hypothetical protein